nr:type II toxin-antitoxin system VapC family toxin [uncultured Rhodopila sp.]
MIGIDTNVLVRYLAQDDPDQSAVASQLFEHRLTAAHPGFINVVAIAETAWVLERSYRLDGQGLAAVIERVLQADALVVQNEQEVFTSMIALKEGRGSFADALIGAPGTAAGCSCTVTFDRKALRLSEFEAVQPASP